MDALCFCGGDKDDDDVYSEQVVWHLFPIKFLGL